MLSRILNWFGKKSDPQSPKAGNRKTPARPGSATAHLFDKQRTSFTGENSSTEEQDGGGFNPYDTGKFDRGASWERISKKQR